MIWLPVFVAVFALLADAALVFGGQARVLRVVQDTNRALAVGRIRDTETATAEQIAKSQIESRLVNLAPHAVATTTIGGGVIQTTVRMPVSDLTSLGLIAAFDGIWTEVTAQHLSEV